MKRTWEVRAACTNNVHLRFLLHQVALHLLDSESLLFEPLLEVIVQKRALISVLKARFAKEVIVKT